jgi:hypothetical protein
MAALQGTGWMRGGAAASLAVSCLCFALRRKLLGRIALGFAAAFLERWREARLSAQVSDLLARSGRDA